MPARYRILLSKRVAADVESIFKHIAQHSEQNAGKMVERILGAIAGLKTFPHRNVVAGQRRGLKNPVRSLPVQSYLVLFRVIDEQKIVRVLRVRHGAMRRPRRFE
jgi:plasmid stabilization system protein ParE